MQSTSPSVIESTSEVRREIDRLAADLERLKKDMADLGGDAVQAARAGAAEARRRVAAAARSGTESVDAVHDQIAAHPFAALAGAFAVGMVLGLGVGRKG